MKKINLNHKNGMWKGSKAGLDAIHLWVIKRKPCPKRCNDCKKYKRLDLANISQKYKRDINDFEWICRKCHMEKDGRLKKLIKRNKDERICPLLKRCEICKKPFKPWRKESTCCSLSCNAKKANRVRWV